MRVNLRTIFIALGLLSGTVGSSYAAEYPETHPLSSWQSFDPADYTEGWLTLDRNGDGSIDYAVMIDDRGYKVREAVDFNHDGRMDDFYFYSNDVLQRQEIDSNYDGRIDIWIYLRSGVYISRWERDRNHDGVIDDRAEYGSENR